MLGVVIKTIIIYVFLLIIMRLMGKRELGQVQTFELVISMIIADIAAVPIYDDRIPVINSLVPVIVLFALHITIAKINLISLNLRKILCGTPQILIDRGKIDEKAIKKENMTVNELQERLREKDVFNLGDVEYAILETSGQISIVLKPEKRNVKVEDLNLKSEYEGIAYDLIIDGVIMHENLRKLGKDVRWLEKEVSKFGIKPKDALVVTINGDDTFFCQAKTKKQC